MIGHFSSLRVAVSQGDAKWATRLYASALTRMTGLARATSSYIRFPCLQALRFVLRFPYRNVHRVATRFRTLENAASVRTGECKQNWVFNAQFGLGHTQHGFSG